MQRKAGRRGGEILKRAMTESFSPGHSESVDAQEVARFDRLAERWWDPTGPLKPLHALNPTRIEFIRDRLAALSGRDPLAERPLEGLRVLDVGCGGGLVCEPLTRLGATVSGIDAAERNIEAAKAHAHATGLAIDYRHETAEGLAAKGERFDAVLALEIVEHVADLEAFLGALSTLTRPNGVLIIATLNRTARSFALAIVGAEYLLGWLPRGTHHWSRFVRPAELVRALRRHGVAVEELVGVSYRALTGRWERTRDLSVNYMGFARKSGE